MTIVLVMVKVLAMVNDSKLENVCNNEQITTSIYKYNQCFLIISK